MPMGKRKQPFTEDQKKKPTAVETYRKKTYDEQIAKLKKDSLKAPFLHEIFTQPDPVFNPGGYPKEGGHGASLKRAKTKKKNVETAQKNTLERERKSGEAYANKAKSDWERGQKKSTRKTLEEAFNRKNKYTR